MHTTHKNFQGYDIQTAHPNEKNGTTMKKLSTKLMAATVLVLGLSSTAQAVNCGDTIGPNETVKLEQDLVCPSPMGSVVLRVVGPATLDLNGHRVICPEPESVSPFSYGVLVEGKNAKVKDGSVEWCRNGITLRGEGRHRVDNVHVIEVEKYGFKVESPRNTLRKSQAVSVGDHGFHVVSDLNKLQDNYAVDGKKVGFVVERGSKNTLTRNVAYKNDGAGLILFGGQGNKLIKNEASRNLGIGIAVLSGAKHQLLRNTASKNGEYGIGVNSGVSRAKVTRNFSVQNDWFDMFQSGDCGDNKWTKNDFETWNRDCIE